jgi:bifunctional UDP-N-acetylglucosamine pyrophosphorylase/glucosamine-1-phosphate N-acetyltransferase
METAVVIDRDASAVARTPPPVQDAAATVCHNDARHPTGYGRIIADAAGYVAGIVEEKLPHPTRRRYVKLTRGIYCFDNGTALEASL